MLVAAVTLASVSGCGFEPIHGQRSLAAPAALSQVEIELIDNRIGQMLRNELLDRFHPRGGGGTRFSLTISLVETLQNLGIRKDSVATRANLALNARYSVTPLGGGPALTTGALQSVNSYNILTSDFATLSAQADARRRAVRQLADRIQERISVWLVQTGGRAVLDPGTQPAPEAGQPPAPQPFR